MPYPVGMTDSSIDRIQALENVVDQNPIERLLSVWGFGLGNIAFFFDIPQAWLRAWRNGHDECISRESREKVLEFDAFLRAALEAGVEDPPMHVECRLVNGYTVTGWDVYAEGERAALLQIMLGAPAAAVLDREIRDWRTRFHSDFEVIEDGDDYPWIRQRR